MKKQLIKILVAIVLMIAGWKLAERGDKITSKEKMQQLKSFCDNAVTTTGFVQDAYTERTIKVGKVRTKTYEFSYDFTVDGNDFVAMSTSTAATSRDSVNVWYDKNNPSKNALSDPCQEYEKAGREKTIGKKGFYYIPGILMLLIGFGLFWSTLKQAIRSLFTRS